MRVMVSLNLADIMTATRPRTSQPRREALDNEADQQAFDREESQVLKKSDQPLDREPGNLSTQV